MSDPHTAHKYQCQANITKEKRRKQSEAKTIHSGENIKKQIPHKAGNDSLAERRKQGKMIFCCLAMWRHVRAEQDTPTVAPALPRPSLFVSLQLTKVKETEQSENIIKVAKNTRPTRKEQAKG